jgi:ABC-type oligopeptide transport system substrate-binding subunit
MYQVIKDERPGELKVSPYLAVYYFGFNLTRPPFSENQMLRRALSMAIDRKSLVKYVTGRGEEPAYGWIPPGVENYSPQKFDYIDLSKEAREAEARSLYKEAGYGPDNPLKFQLRYNTSSDQTKIAIAVQSMWAHVLGADVSLVNEEFKVLISNIQAMAVTELFRLSWTGDYNDAYAFIQLLETDNPSNLTGYSNSTVDALLSQASAEFDVSKRRTLLEEAERVALDDHPVIPLYFYVSKHLVHPRIDGWESNILDIHYSQHLRPVKH